MEILKKKVKREIIWKKINPPLFKYKKGKDLHELQGVCRCKKFLEAGFFALAVIEGTLKN